MISTIIIISLLFSNVMIELYKHGEEKQGKHNFWTSLISAIIMFFIYYSAGLFDKLKL